MRRWPIPPCPSRLDGANSPGAKERARAIAHFTAADRDPGAKFNFSVYTHDEIRTALYEAFAGVCAYCEDQVPSIDVEHYRPKGAIRTDTGVRDQGYYWLAATWTNLLASCPQCNSERWNVQVDGRRVKSGKGTWFPLLDETKRATREGGEADEQPVLLHPYVDEPADHLEFLEEGVVRARCDADGVPSVRGARTIEILGLNRHGLPRRRRDRLFVVRAAHQEMLEAERALAAAPGDPAVQQRHEAALAALEDLVRPGEGYCGLTAQYLGLTPERKLTPA